MQYRMILMTTLALGTTAYASPAKPQITKAPRAEHLRAKRQQPDGGASSVLDAPMTIAAGDTFDGGNAVFDRGVSCSGQSEGGTSDAVFILEAGASLSNVVIGANQVEGVHCMGGCTLTNVWWDAVCEDAFSIKEQADGETTTINGGGAKGAQDKVIQHNGGGTVVINDFTVSDFGKLYRSCGNCDEMPARHVKVTGGSASNGDMLVGINSNMGDTASISGVSISGVESECTDFEGVVGSGEPSEIGPCSGVGNGGSPTTPGAGSPATTPRPGNGGGSGGGSGSSDDEDTGSGDDSGSGSGDNNGDDSGSGSGDDNGDDSGSGSGDDSDSGSGDDSGGGSGDDSGSGSGDDSGSGSGDDSGNGSGDNNEDEGSDSGSGDYKDGDKSSDNKDSEDDSSDSKAKDTKDKDEDN